MFSSVVGFHLSWNDSGVKFLTFKQRCQRLAVNHKAAYVSRATLGNDCAQKVVSIQAGYAMCVRFEVTCTEQIMKISAVQIFRV